MQKGFAFDVNPLYNEHTNKGATAMLDNKFSKGDRVMTHDYPFWMTITEVRSNGWYSCRFGSIGGDAGTFRDNQLTPYTGV